MRYNDNIDKHIMLFLKETPTSSFNELLKRVEKSLKRKPLSRSVFTFHLNELLNDNIVGRHDKGSRGIKVYYFLTEYGKQQFLLYPSKEQEDKERLEKVYQLLLFFVSEYQDKGVPYRLDSEKDFDNFLSRIQVLKNDLEVESVKHYDSGGMYPKENKMYESKTFTRFRSVKGVKIWREDHHQCTSFSLRSIIGSGNQIQGKKTYRITYDNEGKIVLKHVLRKEEKVKKKLGREKVKINDFSYYYYLLPVGGASVSQVVNHKGFVFEHAGLTHEEVRKSFDILKGMDIVRPTKVLFGEIHYSFNPAYDQLRKLLREYWDIQHTIFAKMNRIWLYIRKPTSEEQKWLELFYGEKTAMEILKGNYFHRHNYRRGIKYGASLEKLLKAFTDMSKENRDEILRNTTRQEKEKLAHNIKLDMWITEEGEDDVLSAISDFDKEIKRKLRDLEWNYADIIRKYNFPLKRLREMIYPQYIQNAYLESK
jgi:DNA-binding HxlR family transcriptional regulator